MPRVCLMTIPGKTWKDQKRKRKRVVRTNPTKADILKRRIFRGKLEKCYGLAEQSG